jgi:hypothetical protein
VALDDWQLSKHALEQIAERGLALDDVLVAADRPVRSMPSKRKVGARINTGPDGTQAIIDVDSRTIITVGVNGATKFDWEDHVVARAKNAKPQHDDVVHEIVKPMGPRARQNLMKRMRRGVVAERPTEELQTTVKVAHSADELEVLNPTIKRGVLDQMLGRNWDDYLVLVLSPVKVEIRKRGLVK